MRYEIMPPKLEVPYNSEHVLNSVLRGEYAHAKGASSIAGRIPVASWAGPTL